VEEMFAKRNARDFVAVFEFFKADGAFLDVEIVFVRDFEIENDVFKLRHYLLGCTDSINATGC